MANTTRRDSLSKSELAALNYFSSHGIQLARIPQTTEDTPDFAGDSVLVEVKEVILHEIGLIDADAVEQGIFPDAQNDSTYNAIKTRLKKAARQFRAFDPKHEMIHTVVVFSKRIIANDIYSVWTGKMAPQKPIPFISGGMTLSKEHQQHIDGVVWFHSIEDQKPRHIWAVDEQHQAFFQSLIPTKAE